MDIKGIYQLFICRNFTIEILKQYDGIIKFFLGNNSYDVDILLNYRNIINDNDYHFIKWIQIILLPFNEMIIIIINNISVV